MTETSIESSPGGSVDEVKRKKRKKIIIISSIVGGVIILLVAGFFIYRYYYPNTSPKSPAAKKVDNRVANTLDGTKVEKSLANRHPLAIVVENHSAARPQSGLSKASIVYEAIAEGGITRYLAVYGPNDADKVGPVRSARTYFVDIVKDFNAFFGHVGGNYDALQQIPAEKILDLDQFSLGETAYWRVPQAGKASEHTMYTSTQKLYAAAKEKKWDMAGNFKSLTFKTQDATLRGTGHDLGINFSTPVYKVDWKYDAKTNAYLRSLGGSIDNDATSSEQIAVTTVIVQEVERSATTTAINENGWNMKIIGEGKAVVFMNGKQINATWKKPDATSRTLFYDETGAEISFEPGHFWIEIAPPEVYGALQITPITATPAPATQ